MANLFGGIKTMDKGIFFWNWQLYFLLFFPCFFNSYQQVVDSIWTTNRKQKKRRNHFSAFKYILWLF